MNELIRLKDAIVLLEMLSAARNTKDRQEKINAALHDLRLAQESPRVFALLHLPPGARRHA